MSKLLKLEVNLLTSIIVFVVSLIGFAATSFLLTSENIHVPLGFLYSGGVISLIYLLTHFFVRLDEKRETSIFSIISISIRLVFVIVAALMAALMFYRWEIKLFNIFVLVGVYTFGVLTFIILHIIKRKE